MSDHVHPTEYHDEFSDVLGAYALDAVEPDERLSIETHLRTCPFCSAEVAEHREVAALLSQSGTDAPAGVWDRIAAELSPPAPPLRMSFSPTGEVDPLAGRDPAPGAEASTSNVVPLSGRRSVRNRTLIAALGVAATLLAVLGFVAVDQGRNASRYKEAATSVTTPGPDDLTVKLVGSDDRVDAQAVVNRSGRGYLVSHDLPDPGRDNLYQLWGQVDGVVLSLGTFNAGNDVVNFQLDPDRLDAVQAFAITKERAPGVLASKQDPVLVGEVA